MLFLDILVDKFSGQICPLKKLSGQLSGQVLSTKTLSGQV